LTQAPRARGHPSDTVGFLSRDIHAECPAPCAPRLFHAVLRKGQLVSAGLLKSPHIGVEEGGWRAEQYSSPMRSRHPALWNWCMTQHKPSSVDLAFLLCFSVWPLRGLHQSGIGMECLEVLGPCPRKHRERGLSRGTRGVTQVCFAMLLIDAAVTTIVGGVSISRTIIRSKHETQHSDPAWLSHVRALHYWGH
jgi:hypothetical protein